MNSKDVTNYHRAYEYSYLFKELFSSVIAFSSTDKLKDNPALPLEESKRMHDEMQQLKYDLTVENIILDTKQKADATIKILRNNLELLKHKGRKGDF